jgi:CheY-like chemotaxis protein
VQTVEEHEPDIALLDIPMPVLKGLEAAERIAQAKPAVEVIMVTSNADPGMGAMVIAHSSTKSVEGFSQFAVQTVQRRSAKGKPESYVPAS